LEYSGEDVFIRVIYSDEGNLNIEGFIVNNPIPEEQDMVIGEPAEILLFQTGCAYLLSGHCCDKTKGMPSEGREYSQPWTSTSTLHWAYWVRKAVEYSNDNNCDDLEIQDAIWCITDREGVYNEILKNIGYSLSYPSKNIEIGGDNIAPLPITDLKVDNSYIESMGYPALTWTASGDDGAVGTATYYDIRYASFPFTESDFENLAKLPYSEYVYPSEAGFIDLCLITLPFPEDKKTYYFALKVTDEVGNWSCMSNIVMWSFEGGSFSEGKEIKAYSYPNPAKTCNPTIHIECLHADKIEIKIYTITGEEVYSTEILTPVNIKGNIYVYEKQWKASNIASGIYFCIIKRCRENSVSKKIIKIAVLK